MVPRKDPLSTPLTLSAELRVAIHERNVLTTRSRMKVLSALKDLDSESTKQRKKALLDRTVDEILSSEATYLHQLETVMKYFMEPLRNKPWLSTAAFSSLFGNIEMLYKVNGELLKELKENPENVGIAFRNMAPFLKLYSVYAYDYKQALQILENMYKTQKELFEFVSMQERRPEVATSLMSLLIIPIQRIPRYTLLLRELLSHTSKDEPQHSVIRDALSKMEATAQHVNALVTEYEHAEQLLSLARRLQPCSFETVVPGRKILKQGCIMKASKTGRSSHPRYLVLFNDALLCCKGTEQGVLRFTCLLPLRHCVVEPVLGSGVFKLTCQEHTLLLYTGDKDLGLDWITCLQAAVKKCQDCRQTLRKESSKRRLLRRKDVLRGKQPASPQNKKSSKRTLKLRALNCLSGL